MSNKIIAHIGPTLMNSVTPTFPNSNSTRNQVDEKPLCGSATSKSTFLFSFLIYFFIPLNLSNSNGQGCKQFFFLERK